MGRFAWKQWISRGSGSTLGVTRFDAESRRLFAILATVGYVVIGLFVQRDGSDFWATLHILGAVALAAGWVFVDRPTLRFAKPQRGLFVPALMFGVLFVLHAHDFLYQELLNADLCLVAGARSLLEGQLVHPVSQNCDFPSNVHSWIVAPALAVVHDVKLALRLVSLLAMALTWLSVAGALRILLGESSRWAWLPASASVWSVHLANSSVNSGLPLVPCWVSLQLFLGLKALETRQASWAGAFALIAGLGVWTFYIPGIVAVVALAFFGAVLLQRRDGKSVARVALVLALLVPPALVSAQRRHLLQRHVANAQGAETTVSSQLGHSAEKYAANTARFLQSFVPRDDVRYVQGFFAVTLAYTTFVLLVVGVFAAPFVLPPTYAVFLGVFALANFALYVASNPIGSVWRSTGLFGPIFVFAGVGLAALRRWAPSPKWGVAVFTGLLAVHVAEFTIRYRTYRLGFEAPRFGVEPLVEAELAHVRRLGLENRAFVVPESDVFFYQIEFRGAAAVIPCSPASGIDACVARIPQRADASPMEHVVVGHEVPGEDPPSLGDPGRALASFPGAYRRVEVPLENTPGRAWLWISEPH